MLINLNTKQLPNLGKNGSIPNSVQTPKWRKIEQNVYWTGKPKSGIPALYAF